MTNWLRQNRKKEGISRYVDICGENVDICGYMGGKIYVGFQIPQGLMAEMSVTLLQSSSPERKVLIRIDHGHR